MAVDEGACITAGNLRHVNAGMFAASSINAEQKNIVVDNIPLPMSCVW